jgi:hypothetical protein
MEALLTPGVFVTHPGRPDWGTGQIQSAIGDRVTVSFEHAGKVVVDRRHVRLIPLPERRRPAEPR